MTQIRCFMIDPTLRARLLLRRFAYQTTCDRTVTKCHDAEVLLMEVDVDEQHRRSVLIYRDDLRPEQNALWPKNCACGYAFTESDQFDLFQVPLYRRQDTGEIVTPYDPPIGAMWWLRWYVKDDGTSYLHPQLGKWPLCVETPGGTWIIDSQCSNCTMKEDHDQALHHCWVAHGVPPNVTVDKNGVTCSAGGGSIQAGTYHGFLRNGYLEGG